MRTHAIALCLLVLACHVHAQSTVDAFQKTTSLATPVTLFPTDGGYVLAGGGYVMKAEDDTLGKRWVRRYGSQAAGSVLLSGAYPATGGFRLSGMATNGGLPPFLPMLIQTDTLGHPVWSRLYAPAGITNPSGMAVVAGAASGTGGFFQAGLAGPAPANTAEMFVLKTDAAGQVEWSTGYRSGGTENIRDLKVRSDGAAIVLANSQGASSLFALSEAGQSLWGVHYTGVGLSSAGVGEMVSLALPPSGGCMMAGASATAGAGLLVRTDAIGQVLWAKSYEMAGWPISFASIQALPSGFLVLGHTLAGGQPDELFVLRTDADGQVLDAYRFGTPQRERAGVLWANAAGEWIALGGHGPFLSQSFWAKHFHGSGTCFLDPAALTASTVAISTQNSSLPNPLVSAPISFLAVSVALPAQDEPYTETHTCLVVTRALERPLATAFVVHPNPTPDKAVLRIVPTQLVAVDLLLTSASGRLCWSRRVDLRGGAQDIALDLSALPRGVYWLSIRSDGAVQTQKVLKM